jgi:hypothetical protein
MPDPLYNTEEIWMVSKEIEKFKWFVGFLGSRIQNYHHGRVIRYVRGMEMSIGANVSLHPLLINQDPVNLSGYKV